MTGLNRHTLRPVGGSEHLSQSIADILTTPKGTRVLRRGYGSDLPELMDAPVNGQTLIDVYQATAEALGEWEPRLILTRVQVRASSAGKLELDLSGDVKSAPIEINLSLGAHA